jgi:hypothetical protein
MLIHSMSALVLTLLGSTSLPGTPAHVHAAPIVERPAIPVTNAALADWVNQRAEQWQPTRAERRFDQIGWARDIQAAERLAKEHGRPVFLFTHDGHMATGRC